MPRFRGHRVPYLVKAGEKAAEAAGAKLPDAVAKLWKAVATRFRGVPAAETAAADLAAAPEEPDNQTAFRKELRKALGAVPAFAAEFQRLLDETRAEAGDRIVNTSSGAVATHGSVAAGAGEIAVGGDVHGNVVVGNKPWGGACPAKCQESLPWNWPSLLPVSPPGARFPPGTTARVKTCRRPWPGPGCQPAPAAWPWWLTTPTRRIPERRR